MNHWLITDKGDPDMRALVDGTSFGGKPHYSRQTPGATSFTRNGQNLVFITRDGRAGWVTHRPKSGLATRTDHLDAWENAFFRNEGYSDALSSELVREATLLSFALWGDIPPKDGLITFVRPDLVRSSNPGYCYLCAGWERWGQASDGKPRFRAPQVERQDWRKWSFKGERGGIMRDELLREVRERIERGLSL